MTTAPDSVLTCLVLDDDIDCRDLICSIVGNDPRFAVGASCATAEELQSHLETGEFDVIVTDLMLGNNNSANPLALVVRHCAVRARAVVLVISSLSTTAIARSIPRDMQHRFAFLPKSSSLNRAAIIGNIESLLATREDQP